MSRAHLAEGRARRFSPAVAAFVRAIKAYPWTSSADAPGLGQ